jgi:hypothetical protein
MPAPTVWLLLLYKVARQPSARRVYIWRKLKRLGALLLHDAAWVLPATPRTREQFQWLAAEALLKQLKQPEPDLAAASQQYQQLKQQDYFQSKLGQQVRAALMAAWGGEGE